MRQKGLSSQIGDTLPSRYQVQRILSESASGVTYLVLDTALRSCRAVLKCQHLGLSESASGHASDFAAYASKLRTIRHPGVGTPYAHGTLSGCVPACVGYMTREYVNGVPLSSLAAPLSSDAVAQIGTQLASALSALHTRGVLCRDLQPHNVIVRRANEHTIDALSQCVLIDLTWRPPNDMQLGTVIDMTLQYAAPEVMTSAAAGDMRSDLFSLGVLLYWCASGQRPFTGTSFSQVIRQQRTREYTPLSYLGSDTTHALQELIHRLMDPYPSNRPETADVVVAQLAHLLPKTQTMRPVMGSGAPTTGCFGREPELKYLDATVCDRPAQRERVLEVYGESGVGVTTVLREVQDRAECEGVYVLTCRPTHVAGRTLPDQLAASVGQLVRISRNGAHGDVVQQPSTADAYTQSAVLDDLAIATSEWRVAIFVDDWHLCTCDDRAFIRRLAQQARIDAQHSGTAANGLVLVLGSTQETHDECLGPLGEHTIVRERLRIGPLSRECVQEWISHTPEYSTVFEGQQDVLWQATGGNPRELGALCEMIVRHLASGCSYTAAVAAALADQTRVRLRGTHAEVVARFGSAEAPALCAVTALAYWGGTMPYMEWVTACRKCGADHRDPNVSRHVLEEGDAGIQRVRLAAYSTALSLGASLSATAISRICDAIVMACRGTWSSREPAAVLQCLHFIARCGTMPHTLHWRVLRSLILAYAAGHHAEVYACTLSVLSRATNRQSPAWLSLFNRAAAVELHGADAHWSDEGGDGYSSGWNTYSLWIRSRAQGKQGRWSAAADTLSHIGVNTQRGAGAHARALLLEDVGRCAIASGAIVGGREAQRALIAHYQRIAQFYPGCGRQVRVFARKKEPAAGPLTRVACSICCLAAKVAMAEQRYRVAVRALQCERTFSSGAETRLRRCASWNNEGLALIRDHAPHAALVPLEAAVAEREASGDEAALAATMINYAHALGECGEFARCARSLNRAKQIARRNTLTWLHDSAVLGLAVAYYKNGQVREAARACAALLHKKEQEHRGDTLRKAMYNYVRFCQELWYVGLVKRGLPLLEKWTASSTDPRAQEEFVALRAWIAWTHQDSRALDVVCASAAGHKYGDALESYGIIRDVELKRISMREARARGRALEASSRFEQLAIRVAVQQQRSRRVLAAWARAMVRAAYSAGCGAVALRATVLYVERGAITANTEFQWVLSVLEAKEYRGGREDLRIRIQAHTGARLCQVGRQREGRQLLVDAVTRFATWARRVLRGGQSPRVVEEVRDCVLEALHGHGTARRRASAVGQSVEAAAFSALVASTSGPSRQGGEVGESVMAELANCITLASARADVSGEMLRLAVERSGAERAIIIMDTTDSKPTVVAAWSWDGLDLSGETGDISWAVVSKVIKSNKGCVYSDALTDDELTSHRSIAGLQLRSLLCVPIRADGKARGVLYLDHRHVAGLFGESELGLTELIAAGLAQVRAVTEATERRDAAEGVQREVLEQLVRTERHRVAAELSAGLAHDVKNLMAAVVARCQVLRTSSGGHAMTAGLKAIEKAASTSARMIDSLQECVREPSGQETQAVDVGLLAHEALELLGPRLIGASPHHNSGAGIEVVRLIDVGVCVRGVPGEIRQLFLNLMINACDAMPGGGELRICVKRDDGGRGVLLSVSDTGTGMPESVLKRVFEPFYTTKGRNGTGLGLAVVKSVVLKLGGAIDVKSIVNEGTTFAITIPVAVDVEDSRTRECPG